MKRASSFLEELRRARPVPKKMILPELSGGTTAVGSEIGNDKAVSSHPLERVRDSLFRAARDACRLAEATERLEAVYAKVEDPINNEHFYVPASMQTGRELDPDWHDESPVQEQRPRREAIDAVLALRAAVDEAIAAVAESAVYMDSPHDAADRRWTIRTIGQLRAMRGSILRGHAGDVFPSALPMIRSGVPESMRNAARNIAERLEEVKSILIIETGTERARTDAKSGHQVSVTGSPGTIINIASGQDSQASLERGGDNSVRIPPASQKHSGCVAPVIAGAIAIVFALAILIVPSWKAQLVIAIGGVIAIAVAQVRSPYWPRMMAAECVSIAACTALVPNLDLNASTFAGSLALNLAGSAGWVITVCAFAIAALAMWIDHRNGPAK